MEDFKTILNQTEEDSIEYRESFDKLLMSEIVVIAITKGAPNGTDNFPAWIDKVASINSVCDYRDMTTPTVYISATDYVAYVADDDLIDWSLGGSEPATGAVYFVSINWVKTQETALQSDKTDGSTTAITIGGFNPESDIRNQVAKYPKAGASNVKQDLDKVSHFTEIEIRPVRNTANPYGMISLLNQERNDKIEFFWMRFLHRIVGDASTGTSTNYCYFKIKQKERSTFEYMDDFASNGKFIRDRFDYLGAVFNVSQIDITATTGFLIYPLRFPLPMRNIKITASLGAGALDFHFMTEEDYNTTVGSGTFAMTSGVQYDLITQIGSIRWSGYLKISNPGGVLAELLDLKIEIEFDDENGSSGLELTNQVGTTTIEYEMPTNSRLDVNFKWEERSVRLEVEATKRESQGIRKEIAIFPGRIRQWNQDTFASETTGSASFVSTACSVTLNLRKPSTVMIMWKAGFMYNTGGAQFAVMIVADTSGDITETEQRSYHLGASEYATPGGTFIKQYNAGSETWVIKFKQIGGGTAGLNGLLLTILAFDQIPEDE